MEFLPPGDGGDFGGQMLQVCYLEPTRHVVAPQRSHERRNLFAYHGDLLIGSSGKWANKFAAHAITNS
jgi:hypothetical protein